MASRIFITGATSGFGLATARLFAAKDWDLVLTGRDAKKLQSVAKDVVKAHKSRVTTLAFDIRSLPALRKLQASTPEAFEDVDVLVNNAGLALGTDLLQDADPADWDVVIDTNVKGLLYVTRAVLPGMLSRGSGHIVNIGSTAGHWAYKGGAVYAATKHAVRAINDGLRMDILGSGVRVSSIDPGMAETNFSVVRFRGDAKKAKQVYEGMTPLSAQDIAETIWWVVTRPPHVNVHDLILMPTDQASIRDVHRRASE